jgi:hypothetical protein
LVALTLPLPPAANAPVTCKLSVVVFTFPALAVASPLAALVADGGSTGVAAAALAFATAAATTVLLGLGVGEASGTVEADGEATAIDAGDADGEATTAAT